MSTYQDDYTVDSLISTLSGLVANSWKVAKESYYKEGSREFNVLMSATVRPTEILCELIKSQECTDEHLRKIAFLKAQSELGEELKKRVERILPIKKEANA